MYCPPFDSSILCFCFYSYFFSCKDQLSLKPETGMDPGPRNPNNKFIENGRKCWSESRIKILVYSIKRKELHAHRYKKYPQTCPSSGTKSNEFFFFTVVFLQPFALLFSFFFFFIFFVPFSYIPFSLSSYYILWFLHHFLHPRVGQVLGFFFLYFPCLFLNLPFLAVRLLVHCSSITSTLMRPES